MVIILKSKLFIKLENEEEFEISDKIPELRFLDKKSNPIITNNYLSNTGTNGSIHQFSTFDKSTVTLRFYLHPYDYYDLIQLKREVYQLFMQKRLFRIRTDDNLSMVEFVRMTSFDIAPISDGYRDSIITINADNPSGFKFSRDDSIHQEDLWDDYQLNSDDPILTKDDFEFNQREFIVYNPSDKNIDPYLQKDKLQIVCSYNGSGINIVNETNGSNWQYKNNLSKNDTVILDGINTYENGNLSSLNSNFGNLLLEKGANKIKVYDCNDFNIKFVFPFIYL